MGLATGQFTITDFNDVTIASTAPLKPFLNQLWIDTSVVPNQLKRWDGTKWDPVQGAKGDPGPQGPAGPPNGRNLLRSSLRTVTNSAYMLAGYNWENINDMIPGEDYTVTVWGKLQSYSTGWYLNAYQKKDDGTAYSGYPTLIVLTNTDHQIEPGVWRGTFKMPNLPAGNVWAGYSGLYAYPATSAHKEPATVEKIKIEKGTVGTAFSENYLDIKGPKGDKGDPGTSTFIHVRYSQNADGSGFTTNPAGAIYIGVATTNSATGPTVNTGYQWTKIKGDQGIQGPIGPNGLPVYLHIKYSNDAGKTFTANNGETEGAYMGTYSDTDPADSGDVTKYTWARIRGDKGDTPIVYSTTEPTHDMLWFDLNVGKLKAWSGTEWEAVDNQAQAGIIGLREETEAKIVEQAKKILATVSETYYSAEDVNKKLGGIASQIEQTARSWGVSLTTLTSTVEANKDSAERQFKEIEKTMFYDNDGLHFKNSDSPTSLLVTNEGVNVEEAGTVLARFGKGVSTFNTVEIEESLSVGQWITFQDENGSLNSQFVGGL